VRPGDSVDDNAVLVQVARLDSVRVVAEVSAGTAADLARGDAVYLDGEAPAPESTRAARGMIAQVSLGANPDTRLFRAEAVLDNQDGRLMPGSVVRLAVVTRAATGVPVMPVAALQDQEGATFGDTAPVYVVRDGVAHRVEAGIGLAGEHVVEITSGVNPGDQVVVFGANLLQDGVRVMLHRVDGELVKDPNAGEAGD